MADRRERPGIMTSGGPSFNKYIEMLNQGGLKRVELPVAEATAQPIMDKVDLVLARVRAENPSGIPDERFLRMGLGRAPKD